MIRWLRRQESVDAYTAFLAWVMPEYEATDYEENSDDEDEEDENEELISSTVLPCEDSDQKNNNNEESLPCPPGSTSWLGQTIHTIAKKAPSQATTVRTLQESYGAEDFIPALRKFVKKNLPNCGIEPHEADVFEVYKRVKLQYKSLQGFGDPPEADTIRATPARPAPRPGRCPTPPYFDTALVDHKGLAVTGIEGVEVVQVHIIFKLPPEFGPYPHPLVYVEYFTGCRILAETYGMWVVHRAMPLVISIRDLDIPVTLLGRLKMSLMCAQVSL
ncbi:hypothetical protein M422DRAFT_274764 [Sphaerobolus stellatus SS14]|uniref:Unplaced genomic scaffold SPHSTscaffold_413, whole genome shotgun sequence n=1 Tax=Sphaerobolus stellatus (strain SS14) TaxID=990650 RepID=A0A0C9T6C4_SPHS4|nr:hypothetical protein M422DRAFT_274764 [Sphaerobolus stellatus SS14]